MNIKVVFIAISILLISCSGGGGGDPEITSVEPGVYKGTAIDSIETTVIIAFITSDNNIAIYDSVEETGGFIGTVSGGNITGSSYSYPDVRGSRFSGTINTESNNGLSGSISVPSETYSATYNAAPELSVNAKTADLASLAGVYTNTFSNGETRTYNLQADGTFTWTSTMFSGCGAVGSMSIIDQSRNEYKITTSFPAECGPGEPDIVGIYNGYAFVTDTFNLDDTIDATVTNGKLAFRLLMYKQ